MKRLAIPSDSSVDLRIENAIDALGGTGVDRLAAIEILRDALVSSFSEGNLSEDRLGFSWRSKGDALARLQRPPHGALAPIGSLDEALGSAAHVAIEGDCLEVCKLIERAYFGRVKLVYMNPPFNLDGDVIVDDSDGYFGRYLAYTDTANASASVGPRGGSDHSSWLAMMHLRLLLARNLLSPDGVIFLSIDDHESHRIRAVMDEVFGEENFVACFVWEKRYSPAPDATDVGYVHESILCYRRSDEFEAGLLPMTDDQTGRYKNPDGDPRGPWKPADYTCRYSADERPNLYYPVRHPMTGEDVWPSRSRVWACSKSEHDKNVAENRLWWGANGNSRVPAKKRFLFEIRQGYMPKTLLTHDEVGHTDEATKELRSHLPEAKIKVSPKPTALMRHLMSIANVGSADIVLDCYARTGSLAEAAIASAAETGSGPSTISIDFPERLDDGLTLSSALFRRLRSVSDALPSGRDAGIRLFKVVQSSFRFRQETSSESGSDALSLFETQLVDGFSDPTLLYEIIMMLGLPLTVEIQAVAVGGKTAYVIGENELIVCLEDGLSLEFFEEVAVIARGPIVCKEAAFAGDDALMLTAASLLSVRADVVGAPIELRAI